MPSKPAKKKDSGLQIFLHTSDHDKQPFQVLSIRRHRNPLFYNVQVQMTAEVVETKIFAKEGLDARCPGWESFFYDQSDYKPSPP